MPVPKRDVDVRNLNLQISASLSEQLKGKSEIKGPMMTATLEKILSLFFKNHLNDSFEEDA